MCSFQTKDIFSLFLLYVSLIYLLAFVLCFRNRASAIREVLKLGAKKMGRLLMIGRMEAGLMRSAIVQAPFLFFSFVSSLILS